MLVKLPTLENRLPDHFSNVGSEWTKLYKPIDIKEIKDNCDGFDEDKITLQYMSNFGIDNVRGGSFCQIKLEECEINLINKMINNANDNCFNCGKHGHFTKNCKTKTHLKEEKEKEDKEKEELFFFPSLPLLNPENKEDLNEDRLICKYCNKECRNIYAHKAHENKCKNKNKCIRCGRTNHNILDCHATTHIYGHYIL
jgi:hypothetical protein